MEEHDNVKPMGPLRSLVACAVPAAMLYVAHYLLVPAFVRRTGQPYLVGYLIAWTSTMALFLAGAIVAYGAEGNPMRWMSFAERYRLRRMTGRDWLWTLAVLGFILVTYFGLGFTARWLAQWRWFAPHPIFPPELGPNGAAARPQGTLFGTVITGSVWVAVVYLVGWFLNIAGEELWFRGYLLPRQERAMGAWAWIANGLVFTLNHVWQPWNLLLILPGALFAAYVVQRRRNTWILIIPHGLGNALLLALTIVNAFGVSI